MRQKLRWHTKLDNTVFEPIVQSEKRFSKKLGSFCSLKIKDSKIDNSGDNKIKITSSNIDLDLQMAVIEFTMPFEVELDNTLTLAGNQIF